MKRKKVKDALQQLRDLGICAIPASYDPSFRLEDIKPIEILTREEYLKKYGPSWFDLQPGADQFYADMEAHAAAQAKKRH